jgi:hypothetical protein
MPKKLNKPPEGAKMKDTADMIAWREEFEQMDTEEHLLKLKALGLTDEELEEFKEMEEGKVPLEEELLHEGPELKSTPKKAHKKK